MAKGVTVRDLRRALEAFPDSLEVEIAINNPTMQALVMPDDDNDIVVLSGTKAYILAEIKGVIGGVGHNDPIGATGVAGWPGTQGGNGEAQQKDGVEWSWEIERRLKNNL